MLSVVAPKQAWVKEQEVQSLLAKEAIEHVPSSESNSGFYSWYFIISKKDGGVASHDRSTLVKPYSEKIPVQKADRPFHREPNQIQGLVCQVWSKGCILPHIYPSSTQKTPEVCFLGRSIPIALYPSTFVKYMDAALVPLRLQAIRVLNFIDDWLISAVGLMAAASKWYILACSTWVTVVAHN